MLGLGRHSQPLAAAHVCQQCLCPACAPAVQPCPNLQSSVLSWPLGSHRLTDIGPLHTWPLQLFELCHLSCTWHPSLLPDQPAAPSWTCPSRALPTSTAAACCCSAAVAFSLCSCFPAGMHLDLAWRALHAVQLALCRPANLRCCSSSSSLHSRQHTIEKHTNSPSFPLAPTQQAGRGIQVTCPDPAAYRQNSP